MTPEDIALVRESLRLLGPGMEAFGAVFYNRLFETNPALRDVFPGNLDSQKRALAAMLELIVKMLDMRDKLVPLIRYLGERHQALHVKPEYYAPFGETLIWTLDSFLREDFTPPMRRAWEEAYAFMADNMK